MNKIAIVYWSGTGNTKMMAENIKEGAKAAGAETSVFTAAEFSEDKIEEFDAVAFGCPAMGLKNWRTVNLNRCLPHAKTN